AVQERHRRVRPAAEAHLATVAGSFKSHRLRSVGNHRVWLRLATSAARLVPSFRELLDDLAAERRQVVGLAAGDDAVVGHHLLVHHLGAGVAQVGAHAGPGGHAAPTHHVGFDHYPRAVADHAHRLAAAHEITHEAHRVLVHAQRVGIEHAARQDQRIELVDAGIGHLSVNLEPVAGLVVVYALDLAVLDRQQTHGGARLFHRLPG